MDHQCLIERLKINNLREVKVAGDGNCQFRALLDQLYGSDEHHIQVRKEVVKQLQDYQSSYECFEASNYEEYCDKMKIAGEWGDNLTLQAAADKYLAKINVLNSFSDKSFIDIKPRNKTPERGKISK